MTSSHLCWKHSVLGATAHGASSVLEPPWKLEELFSYCEMYEVCSGLTTELLMAAPKQFNGLPTQVLMAVPKTLCARMLEAVNHVLQSSADSSDIGGHRALYEDGALCTVVQVRKPCRSTVTPPSDTE